MRRLSGAAFAALCSVSAVVPTEAATTINIPSQVWKYYDPTRTGNYQSATPGFGGPNAAYVGELSRPGTPLPNGIDGYYASILDFLLPALPANALITGATLNFTYPSPGSGGTFLVGGQVRQTSISDASRLYQGTPIGSYLFRTPQDPPSLDLTDITSIVYAFGGAGQYLGISLRMTDFKSCAPTTADGLCYAFFGASTETDPVYRSPSLSLTYDIPVLPDPDPPSLPSNVPEPSSWAMMILGFGMIGSALRRRTVHAQIA